MWKDPISSFCSSLASFCNHLQSSCDALKQSIDRRPIPLDSASTTFVQCLNRRVSSSSSDLELLDSMTFGTVSFEELLGHCNELYKKNQSDLVELADCLKSYGYVPGIEDDEINEVSESLDLYSQLQVPEGRFDCSSSLCLSMADSSFRSLEEDDLLDESLSLKRLGLSDACMATLASEADLSSKGPEKLCVNRGKEFMEPHQPVADKMVVSDEKKYLSYGVDKEKKSVQAPSPGLKVLKSDFECLPAYLRNLVSWEDILVAVDKINSSLSKKTNGCNFFRQDEIPSFELGPKTRSYLLLLVRMNRLVVETIDGLLSYRVL